MKKAIGSLLLFLAVSVGAMGQEGAEGLVSEGASFLGAFLGSRADARVAVVRFENQSELSDLAMQKLYQMLLARLESEKKIRILDLLLNFSGGHGEFNLSQAGALDYLIELKLIQNKSKTGLGLTVFSRRQDRVVAMKYVEKPVSRGEMDFLNSRAYGFSELGFSRLLEFESRAGLMDIQSLPGADGQEQYYFYYPDEIVIYGSRETRLEKHSQFKLAWTRPIHPALHPEGKLLLFRQGQDLLLTAGGNFSPQSLVLTFRDGQWRELGRIDFVPFRLVTLNQSPYLVGARYEEGQNFFKDRIYFMPFDPAAAPGGAGAYEKKTCPAMAIDFATRERQLQGVHIIDRSYAYRLFTADLAERTPIPEKKGASLAVNDDWLAVSDYRRTTDELFFYDLRDSGLRPVYSAKVAGEVQFIASGTWQGVQGFWTGVRQQADGLERFLVQFWGKRHE